MGGLELTECRGFVLAAPASASGKTTVALGILRWMALAGLPVRAAKCGPDYIDPTFHAVASGHPSVNLDAWAMPEAGLRKLAACPANEPQPPGFLLVEGAMGVIDGSGSSQAGSAADLSGKLGLPIVLVIDVSGQGASAVLPVLGLRSAFRAIEVKGVILNRLGSERHRRVVRTAMAFVCSAVCTGMRISRCRRAILDLFRPASTRRWQPSWIRLHGRLGRVWT